MLEIFWCIKGHNIIDFPEKKLVTLNDVFIGNSLDNIDFACLYSWRPFIEVDPKAAFSIASTPKCREGRYSIPWIAPLYPILNL